VLWLVLRTLLQLFFGGFHIVMLAAVIILLGGAYVQGVGYGILYQPDGQFIKVTYPSGYSHHVLAQCVGPLNSTLPVVWVEVGGGGHSSSDLWGLRDYILLNYPQVRYCVYDFPGTGWSDPMLAHQPLITQQLMTALHVDGPVVCVGNMDHADERCLLFCSANPKKCKAVVPVGFSLLNEFEQIVAFFNQSRDEVNAIAKSSLEKRLSLCDQYSAWQSVSGLIATQIPDMPGYVPQARVTEFHFLNLMNEKQWTTNCRMLQLMLEDPAGPIGSPTPWTNASIPLDAPVWAFIAGMTSGNLNAQCGSMELNSPGCRFIHFQYLSTLAGNMAVVARNPQSKLFMCGGDATGPQAGSNSSMCIGMNGSYFVDQAFNIPWFAQTLISAMQSL
jgi:pimeloyl-ACP methyl ester carboxylesterase